MLRKDMKPHKGDGIAFYHSTKARFAKHDKHHGRARISLMGEILSIEQNERDISKLSVRIRRSDLDRMHDNPIVNDEETKPLFEKCDMRQGPIATFYEVPPAVWAEFRRRVTPDGTPYPDDVPADGKFREGAAKTVSVNAYERNQKAHDRCIEHWGTQCVACGMDFGERYGERGEGYIHVHHLLPLAEIATEYEVDPILDLRPVCPNCHAIIHRRTPALSVDELAQLLQQNMGEAHQ